MPVSARAWRDRYAIPAAIVCAFVVLCLAYARATPMFEPPDEASHFLYIHNLIEEGALPVLVGHDAMFASQSVQRHHPPLYYLAGALLAWPFPREPGVQLHSNPFAAIGTVTLNNQNVYLHPLQPDSGTAAAVTVLRLFSTALGAGTLIFIFAIGQLAFGRGVGLCAMLLAACIPGFIFIHASINNDNLVTFLYTVGLYWLLRVWVRRTLTRGDGLLLALILGGIALSKINGLTLFGVVYGWLILGALIGRLRWRAVLETLAISLAGAALLAGWWYARNWALYGDPLALQATLAVWGRGPLPTDAGAIASEAKGIWESFWMVLGHLNIRGAAWVYAYAAAITALGLLGCLRASMQAGLRWRMLILLSAAVVVTAALWLATRQINVSQGRILYPAMAAFCVLLCLGWRSLLGRAAPLLILPLALAAIGAPLTVLPAAYRPPLPVAALPTSASPLSAEAGGVQVLGYRYQPQAVMSPDDAVTLDLYVRAGAPAPDPILFVKLLDPISDVPVGGADVYPGMTVFSDFDPGQRYAVRVRFPIDRTRLTGRAPRQMRLLIGLRLPDPNDAALETPPLPWLGAGGDDTSAYLLLDGPTLIDPDFQPPPPETAARVRFGAALELAGYTLPPAPARPGETIAVTLYWRRVAPMPENVVAAIFLQNAAGDVIAQADGPLAGYPTSAWRGDGLIADTRMLTLRADAPPGDYALAVGWYQPATLARVPAVGDGADAAQNLFITPPRVRVEQTP